MRQCPHCADCCRYRVAYTVSRFGVQVSLQRMLGYKSRYICGIRSFRRDYIDKYRVDNVFLPTIYKKKLTII